MCITAVGMTNGDGARVELIGGAEAVLVGVGGTDLLGRGSREETIPGIAGSVTSFVGVEGMLVNVILVDVGDLGSPGSFRACT